VVKDLIFMVFFYFYFFSCIVWIHAKLTDLYVYYGHAGSLDQRYREQVSATLYNEL
jgi:hypothetical protein